MFILDLKIKFPFGMEINFHTCLTFSGICVQSKKMQENYTLKHIFKNKDRRLENFF